MSARLLPSFIKTKAFYGPESTINTTGNNMTTPGDPVGGSVGKCRDKALLTLLWRTKCYCLPAFSGALVKGLRDSILLATPLLSMSVSLGWVRGGRRS